jgi:hypothetical protein
MAVEIHRFDSTGEAYDESQCDDAIHDGDVLVVASEGVVGILVKAWPIAITEASGAFHTVKPGATFTSFVGDNYPTTDYRASLVVAQTEAALMPKGAAEPITVRYQSIDGVSETRSFPSIWTAQNWPQRMIGRHPTLGSHYAVSDDGVGKITVTGCTLADIFPEEVA